jgi:hypothetical protein
MVKKREPDYPCDFCNQPVDQNVDNSMFRLVIRSEWDVIYMVHICFECVGDVCKLKKSDTNMAEGS